MNPARRLLRAVLLVLAFAVGTAELGWWAVPAVAALWAIVARDTRRPAIVAGLAAGVAWDTLFIWARFMGPTHEVARLLGDLTGLGSLAWYLATLVFPMVLAWAAAETVLMVTPRAPGREEHA